MRRTDEDIEDELLVLRCQAGDGEALRALVKRWQPRLGRVARHLTGDREAAGDVLQDAWLAIVRGIRRLDDPARFRTWAFRIVTNRCTDWLRRKVVRRKFFAEARNAGVPTSFEDSGESDSGTEVARLRDALTQLPEDQRTTIALHYLEGMGIAEIARVLDVPAGTVKSRLFNARERLRIAMERTEP